VVVNYSKNSASAEEVVAQIQSSGGKAIAIQADISELTAIEQLFTQTMEKLGKLDILVNNAGISEFRSLAEVDEAFYTRFFNVNVRAPLFAMQAASRYFGESGGRIINITSGVTQKPIAQTSVYAGTKAALEVMTRTLATELGSRQITVNAVAPGVIATDMLGGMVSEEWQQSLIEQTPLGRMGAPEDIADVVAFLASDDSRWVTGEIIAANGGLR
jgi:3-oxoacyl-[acyl-carrier protein] reductase